MASDWNFIQTKQKGQKKPKQNQQSEIHVVYLMGKIIARQMKQSMTRSNQREWLGTQVGREVRLLALLFAVITPALIRLVTPPFYFLTAVLTKWLFTCFPASVRLSQFYQKCLALCPFEFKLINFRVLLHCKVRTKPANLKKHFYLKTFFGSNFHLFR